jgi:hypothetical protein
MGGGSDGSSVICHFLYHDVPNMQNGTKTTVSYENTNFA